jgi:hypothetical protein
MKEGVILSEEDIQQIPPSPPLYKSIPYVKTHEKSSQSSNQVPGKILEI